MPKLPQPFSEQSVANWIAQFQGADAADERLRALQAIGVQALPQEIERCGRLALMDADASVRALAAKLLGGMGIPASDETDSRLISLLADADPDVRFESARALVRRKSAKSRDIVPVLLAFLDEGETHALMVAAVINVLVEMDLDANVTDGELSGRLQRLLDHDRAEVREAVSIAFAKWPSMSRACTHLLVPLLDDSEPVVREKIAETLGQAGVVSASIRTALEAASHDEDSEVARVATEALGRLEVIRGSSA